MKKALLFLLLIPLFACEGPTGPEGPPGTNIYSTYFTVPADKWEIYETNEPGVLNSYYYYNKEIPGLTRDIFEEGVVLVYIDLGNGVKEPLFRTVNRGEYYDGDKDNNYLWSENFMYDFYYNSNTRKGGVGIYVVNSDFILNDAETYTFDVRLIGNY